LISTEADNAQWAPDGKWIAFTSAVYPDCAAITAADFTTGNKCNADRDASLAASKVKAQVFTHLLYRHWNHYTGDKRSHLFIVSVDNGTMRDLTPNDPHDVPPFSIGGGGGFAISPDSKELAFTENLDPEPATSVSAKIFTLDLTNPAAKPVLNDALLSQLDLPKMESFWFTAADKTKVKASSSAPGVRPREEVSAEVPDPRRAAGGVGRCVELSLEPRAVCRERLCGGDDQSARLDRLRAGVRRWRQRRLGRQALTPT
jgi:Tol biopolymer transport system component